MSVSSVTAVPSAPPAREGPVSAGPVQAIEREAPSSRLASAVQIDIRAADAQPQDGNTAPKAAAPAAEERRISVDRDTKSIVYQVIDPGSGDVVVQLPDASVLKTRAYAEAQAAARQQRSAGPVDRKA